MPHEETEHRFLRVKWQLIEENAPTSLADLEIDGEDVTARGFSGERVGEILKELLRTCIIDPRLNNAEWLHTRLDRMAQKEGK